MCPALLTITLPPSLKIIEHDDGGHDNNQYETGDSMQLIGDGGYSGYFGGFGGWICEMG